MRKNNNFLPAETYKTLSPAEGNIQPESEGTFTQKHKYKIDGGLRGVRSVNVSHDNKYLVITYEENTPRIRIFDLQKFEFLPHEYAGHTASVRLTNISPDNKVIHTASWDGSSRRYIIDTGECTLILSGFGRSPSCYLDSSLKYLFTASYDSDCFFNAKNAGRCWDLSSGRLMTLYQHTKERSRIESMDIVYDDGMVYTGSDDGCLYSWSLDGGNPLKELCAVDGSVRKLAVSSNFIVAACTDKTVRVFNKSTGDLFRCFYHQENDVRTVLISRDENVIWSATDNGKVYSFSLKDGDMIFRRKVDGLWIWSISLMQNEQVLVTGSGDGCVTFISAYSGKIIARLHNLLKSNDVLITCPPDKIFPHGFFYTSNKDLIIVLEQNNESGIINELSSDNITREVYINKLNLKNLIITRLNNPGHFNALTGNHLRNNNLLNKEVMEKIPRALKA